VHEDAAVGAEPPEQPAAGRRDGRRDAGSLVQIAAYAQPLVLAEPDEDLPAGPVDPPEHGHVESVPVLV